MAINYASRFESMALEAFSLNSVTEGVFSAKYSWDGVKTVNVFTNETVALGAYTRTAGYGTPTFIGNTYDTLTVAQDIGFSAIIDKLDMESTEGTMRAAAWLGEQTRQRIVPTLDKYRFLALYTACPSGQISASAAITSANAYSTFLTAQGVLDEALIPEVGRVAFCTPAYLNSAKVDTNFVLASDLAQDQVKFRGQVGEIDGVPIIKVPTAIMNATDHHMDFILVHKDAVAAPVKLTDTQVYETVPGYSGSEIDARIVHDLFLLDTLNNGIYIHVHA